MLTIEFYHHEAGSTSSQKVKLCLHYKELDYKSFNIVLSKGQNQAAEYLEINRHGLVPAIIHNGKIIVEANLINEYLDRVFPEQKLMPDNPQLIYQVQYLCKQQEYINEQCFRYLSYQHSGRVNRLTDNEIQNHTQLDRRRFLRTMKHGLSSEHIHEIQAYLVKELSHINTILEKNHWLCGNIYTLADIAWTAGICRLEQLDMLDILTKEKLIHLLRWYEKVKSMSHFCGYHFK